MQHQAVPAEDKPMTSDATKMAQSEPPAQSTRDPDTGRRLDAAGARVLAVGLAASQIDPLMAGAPLSCVFVRFAQMTDAFLEMMAADLVVAPLFGADFDVLDLVDRLVAAGFKGKLLALTPPLPRPDAVRAEVRVHAPGMDFELVIAGPAGGDAGPG